MRDNKYLYLWLGVVLMIFSGINFYKQDIPPNSKIMLRVYNYLHGGEIYSSSSGGWYSNDSFHYNLSRQMESHFYVLHYLQFTDRNTVLHFTIKHLKAGSSKEAANQQSKDENINIRPEKNNSRPYNDPFPDPVIATVTTGQSSNIYPLLRKYVRQSSGSMTVDLYFPLINRSYSQIMVWHDYANNHFDSSLLFTLADPSDAPRIKGPTIWGIIFLFGFVLFIKGIYSNPARVIRKFLVKEANAIDKGKNKLLENILGWSTSFKKLSEKDQNRYSSTISFFDEIQNTIFDFNKYVPFKRTNMFEQGFQLLLLLILFFLSAILIFFCFKLIVEPNASIDKLLAIGKSYSNLTLYGRIASLENTKLNLSKLLFAFLLFGCASIVFNVVLGALRVKLVARQEIGLRLIEYDKTLVNQLKIKTKPTEDSIGVIEKKVADIEDKYDRILMETTYFATSKRYELVKSSDRNLNDMKKGYKKTIKTFKHELKNHLKNKRRQNAEK